MIGRIRTVKPEIFSDEKLWDLSQETGLPLLQAFEGLWCYSDREGRFEWRPRALKTLILPYWEGDFAEALEALERGRYVVRYLVDGQAFGYVRGFAKHQRVNPREQASILPAPPVLTRANPEQAPVPEPSPPVDYPARGEGKGRELEGKGVGTELARAPVEVPGLEIVHPLPPSRRDQAREAEAARLGTTPAIPHRFDPKWDPNDEHRARGHELGLTDDQMLEEAEDCRRKIYTHGFSTEDDQFFRELKWLATDLEKKRFQELNRHGRDKFENPGRDRSAG